MVEKNVAPTGKDPASANEIGNGKDTQNGGICDESVIIYRSWFECLKEQGIKKFAMAMIALLSFAFYGVDVKSHRLPRQLEAIIETFTPVIITNRKKRKGGDKGKEFGKDGGRPLQNGDSKTPKGLSNQTPKGDCNETPLDPPYNVNVTGIGNVKETVSVNGTTGQPSPHTDFKFFIPVFFFRNVRRPEHQAKKFVEHYAPTGWKLSGGEYMATDEQRIALAQRWEIRDDTTDRFKPEVLAMWRELYLIAPEGVKPQMLVPTIQFQRANDKAIIACPKTVAEWIEKNRATTEPIVIKWIENRKLNYAITE